MYRFESCSTGEKIVSSGGVAVTPWINPHSGTVAAASITNNVGYTWSTYITNNDPATQPYRVTVIVQWASAAYPNKTNNLVRVQSLFASPAGCVNSSTHPFGAPCQPFFYGLAQVPAGKIAITGTVQGLTFSTGYLQTTGTESNLQNEQVTRGHATFAESLASITDGLGTRTEGGVVSGAQAADSDPNAPGATYGTTSEVAGIGGTRVVRERLDLDRLHRPPSDTGRADAAVVGRRSEHLPAAGRPGGDRRAPVRGRPHATGRHAVVDPRRWAASSRASARRRSPAWRRQPSNPVKSFVDREAVSGQDGRIEVTATRNLGVMGIGAFPSGIAAPGDVHLSAEDADRVPGHRHVAGGDDHHGCAVDRNAHGQRAVLERRRAIRRLAPTAAGLNNLTSTATSAATIAGRAVVVTISVNAGSTAAQPGTHQTNPSGSLRTDVDSSVAPFSATVHYVVTVDGRDHGGPARSPCNSARS